MNDIDVKEIREKSGLTQEELAERMGMYKKICADWVHIKVVRVDHFINPIIASRLFCEPDAVILLLSG